MVTALQDFFALTTLRIVAAEFPATVISVHDGDTITVLYNARHIRIRLDSVDTPELQQAFGDAARQFTADLALGKTVTIDERDVDRYGRTVAVVTLPDGSNLNHELARAGGYSWWYRRYAPADSELRALESEARKLAADYVPKRLPWRFGNGENNRTSQPVESGGSHRRVSRGIADARSAVEPDRRLDTVPFQNWPTVDVRGYCVLIAS